MIELGCGSGATAAALSEAGHEVLGIDASRAMVALARRRAPEARFRVGSWVDEPIPECDAVLAIGEVLGYVGSADGHQGGASRPLRARALGASPRRALRLRPGDARARADRRGLGLPRWATTGRSSTRPRRTRRAESSSAGSPRSGGSRAARPTGAPKRSTASGSGARGEIEEMLRDARFKVQTRRGYGGRSFAPGHRVFVARA